LMIEIPTSGRLYRFAKTIVKDEELFITVSYMQSWIGALVRILFFAILAGAALLVRQWFVKGFYFAKNWISAHKHIFVWLQTPAGTRVLLACGAILFWFTAKVLFVIITLLLLVSWLKPQWIFKHLRNKEKPESTTQCK